ncbi:MAG: hypothetical protein DYH12_08350 [Sorangiineae bacterium PRO1]|nr:hypothetical protein [Sorangiineae bacterium PRO1]
MRADGAWTLAARGVGPTCGAFAGSYRLSDLTRDEAAACPAPSGRLCGDEFCPEQGYICASKITGGPPWCMSLAE